MAKRKLKFPQISRKITASFKILGVSGLILWLGFNLFPSFSPIDNLKIALLKNLTNPAVHLNLITQLLKNNQLEEAEKEVFYSLQFSPGDKNLLAKLAEIKRIKNEPASLRQEIKKWQKIASEKPDYRDAYFQLAILYYQLYNDKKSKEYLTKTLSLDPNFEPAKELLRKIKG